MSNHVNKTDPMCFFTGFRQARIPLQFPLWILLDGPAVSLFLLPEHITQ